MKSKKEMYKFVTGLCLLGMGLGVNLDEAWAGMKKSAEDKVSTADVELPAVQHDKWIDGVKQPSVRHDKWIEKPAVEFAKKPSAEFAKRPSSEFAKQPSTDFAKKPSADFAKHPSADFAKTPNPSVNRVKPVPATKLPR